jgi:hypothetical protein
VILVLCTFVAFYLLLTGPIRAQRTTALDACWHHYPDWSNPLLVPLWSVKVFLQLLEHLWRPTGGLLILPALLGAVSLWRRNKRPELILLVGPGLLGMLASWMHAYPFESRVVLFVVGPLTLLIGEGIRVTLEWVWQRTSANEGFAARRVRRSLVAGLVVVAVALGIPFARTAYHVVDPAPRLTVEKWPEETAQIGNVSLPQ